jgi:Protein of unknown function, DUF547
MEARPSAPQSARLAEKIPRLEKILITSQLQRRAIISIAISAVFLPASPAFSQSFDHSYGAWDTLLKKHVKWLPDNKQSRVNYKGFAADRAELKKVLEGFSALSMAQFNAFSKEQQQAFLINAYNAFTVEHILSKYPDLKSIKDLGSIVQSAWKKKFFTLLGEERHLDWIEHEQLRPKYAEPRVHVAVNCASIGCPALFPEAFTAPKLDAMLEDGMRRFLGDRSRNKYEGGKLQVSNIFKWFKEDFEKGNKGFSKVEDVFAKYADLLTPDETARNQLKAKTVSISHLDYDWSLNDLGR